MHWQFEFDYHPFTPVGVLTDATDFQFDYFRCYELEGINDAPSHRFAFGTCLAESLNRADTATAVAIGDDVAKLILGAVRIFHNLTATMQVASVWYDEMPCPLQTKAPQPNLSQTIFATHFCNDDALLRRLEHSPLRYVFYRALQGGIEATLLTYFSQELTWSILYNICETIFHHAPEGWLQAFEADKRRLGKVANNFALTGIDSRHGDRKQSAPSSANDMTIEEGRLFCQKLAFAFLTQVQNPALAPDAREPINPGRRPISADELF
jgi:hypothetical protein